MNKNLGTILRLIISLGLIALVLYLFRDRLPEVAASLASARLWLVAIAILIFWLAMTIDGIKWWVLLRVHTQEVPLRAMLNYTFVGFFFTLLPANMIGGDVMRGYGLTRYTHQTAAAASSVVLNRIIGLAAYMSVAVVSALITVFVTGRSDLQILAIMAAGASILLIILATVLLSRRVRKLVDHIINGTFLRRLGPIWASLSQAFEAYRAHAGALFIAYGIALLGVASTSSVNYILSEAIGGGIAPLHVFLFTPLIAMVLIIPLNIAGLGLSQGVTPAFYSLVGVNPAHALSLSVMVSATQLFCSLPGGLLWLRWKRQSPDPDPIVDPAHD